jgi:hypothetical protein
MFCLLLKGIIGSYIVGDINMSKDAHSSTIMFCLILIEHFKLSYNSKRNILFLPNT